MILFNLRKSAKGLMINFLERHFKVVRNFHLLMITLIIPMIGKAQDKALRDNFTFGVKIGTNISNVYDSDGEAFVANPKTGLALGAFATIPLVRLIAVQPELLISQRGFKSSGRLLGGNYDLTRTSTFIDVPILFVFRPVDFVSLIAGPQYSYLTHQKNEFKNGTTGIVQEQEFENEDLRRNLLCFTGGIDVNIKHIVVGGRFGVDLQNNRPDGSSTTPRYKNMWYQFTIGYRFF